MGWSRERIGNSCVHINSDLLLSSARIEDGNIQTNQVTYTVVGTGPKRSQTRLMYSLQSVLQ